MYTQHQTEKNISGLLTTPKKDGNSMATGMSATKDFAKILLYMDGTISNTKS
jgi:hypothetical protein